MIDINEYIKKSKKERQKHIDLEDECIYRGGDSIQFRGLLAYYLDTNLPSKRTALCCHACNNSSCSNPKHLYWGTNKENHRDGVLNGTIKPSKLFGVQNGKYGLPPWENVNSKPDSWIITGYIFKEYYLKNWDFSKYGKGPSYFQDKYCLSQGCSKEMIKKFRNGWNPFNDKSWINFCKNNKKLVEEICKKTNICLDYYAGVF